MKIGVIKDEQDAFLAMSLCITAGLPNLSKPYFITKKYQQIESQRKVRDNGKQKQEAFNKRVKKRRRKR